MSNAVPLSLSWLRTIRGMSQGRPIPPEHFEQFLALLREMPNVTRAARTLGHAPRSFRNYRERDPDFAEAWDAALEEGIENCEAELHRRAFEGTDKPITHQGVITGSYKEYSDTLAMFLLKAHRPEKYRERQDISHTGAMSLTVATGVPSDDGSDLAG